MTTSHDERQYLWDHRLNRGRGGWLSHKGEVSHAYVRRPEHLAAEVVCREGLFLASSSGLEPYPPEAPICPECADITGLAALLGG